MGTYRDPHTPYILLPHSSTRVKHIPQALPSHKGSPWITKTMGETEGPGDWTPRRGIEGSDSYERGSRDPSLKNLIKGEDHSLSRKSTILCVWHTPTFYTARELKDPCNSSAELLGHHRPQPHTKAIDGPVRVPYRDRSPCPRAFPTSQESNSGPKATHLLP